MKRYDDIARSPRNESPKLGLVISKWIKYNYLHRTSCGMRKKRKWIQIGRMNLYLEYMYTSNSVLSSHRRKAIPFHVGDWTSHLHDVRFKVDSGIRIYGPERYRPFRIWVLTQSLIFNIWESWWCLWFHGRVLPVCFCSEVKNHQWLTGIPSLHLHVTREHQRPANFWSASGVCRASIETHQRIGTSLISEKRVKRGSVHDVARSPKNMKNIKIWLLS